MSKDSERPSLSATQVLRLTGAKPQGKRPKYFPDPMSEQTYSIAMALMAELAAARERIDTLERVLVSKGHLESNEIESYVPSEEAGYERQLAQVQYCARVLRPLQQQVEGMERSENLSTDEAEHQPEEMSTDGKPGV
ncbi:MAG: hypothetical protein AB8G16_15740 [Gammaproteobacteria bacterium]